MDQETKHNLTLPSYNQINNFFQMIKNKYPEINSENKYKYKQEVASILKSFICQEVNESLTKFENMNKNRQREWGENFYPELYEDRLINYIFLFLCEF